MRLPVCILLAAAACSPSPRKDHTGVDAGRDGTTGDATAALCYAPSVSGTVTPGTSSIEACAIWNSIAKLSGAVTLTRSGATLDMAFASGVTFSGTVVDRAVTLTYTHLHSFEDGCLWRATETLTGDLDPATCVMTVGYHYVETVETNNGGCATPCAGTGTFSLSVAPIL